MQPLTTTCWVQWHQALTCTKQSSWFSIPFQAPDVQRVGSTLHWINHSPLENLINFDKHFSTGQWFILCMALFTLWTTLARSANDIQVMGKYIIQSNNAAFMLCNDISTKLDFSSNLVFKCGTLTRVVFNPFTPKSATDTYRFYSV